MAKLRYYRSQLLPWHYCKLCNIPDYNLICQHCLNEIELLDFARCKRCLAKLSQRQANCENCNALDWHCDQVFSRFKYATPLSKLLHALKYNYQKCYAASLSYLMYQSLPQPMDYDVIIPIPLHYQKLKRRGFNQADILLQHFLAFNHTIPVNTNFAIRTIDTVSQTLTLNADRRKANLACAFQLNTLVDFANAKILLVDDVVTTGATINALARILKERGAIVVDAWCLMRR